MKYCKLEKTCNRILALEEDFILDMKRYESTTDCGTTYCIAGILANKDGYPDDFAYTDGYDFNGYIHACLIGGIPRIFPWLFDYRWPNSLEHAKARAQYLLDNNFNPPLVYHREQVTLGFLSGDEPLFGLQDKTVVS